MYVTVKPFRMKQYECLFYGVIPSWSRLEFFFFRILTTLSSREYGSATSVDVFGCPVVSPGIQYRLVI